MSPLKLLMLSTLFVALINVINVLIKMRNKAGSLHQIALQTIFPMISPKWIINFLLAPTVNRCVTIECLETNVISQKIGDEESAPNEKNFYLFSTRQSSAHERRKHETKVKNVRSIAPTELTLRQFPSVFPCAALSSMNFFPFKPIEPERWKSIFILPIPCDLE